MSVATDATVVHFHDNDFTVGVNDECAAFGHACFFDEDTKVATQGKRRIANHRELHQTHGRAGFMPSHVCEVAIGGDRIDFNAKSLKGVVVKGQVLQFGRADKGEVCRVEEHDGPLAKKVV